MVDEAAERLKTLESKMDNLSDLFRQVVTNQELMQQELKIMNVTLTKVDNLHLQLTACSTGCKSSLSHIQKEMSIHLNGYEEYKKMIDDKFKSRDRVGTLIIVGILLSIFGTIVTHVMSGGM